MNRNKVSHYIAIFTVLLFWAFVLLLQVYKYAPSSEPKYASQGTDQVETIARYANITFDAANTYAPIIQCERKVTDWHSALYMYECRAALHCAKALSIPANGISIQIAAYYLHLGILLIFVSCLLYRLICKNLWFFLLSAPLAWSTKLMFVWMKLGLDFFFFVHLTVLCITLAYIPVCKSKGQRTLAWIIIAIALFHTVNFRKNAILLVPFVTFTYTYVTTFTKKVCLASLLKWVLITAAFSLAALKVVAWTLPVIHRQPVIPMLSSDLRIAAVLRGEQAQFKTAILQSGGSEKKLNHPYKDSLTAYWGTELMSAKGRELIPHAYGFYLNHWIHYPGSMFTARLIQVAEFYCGGSLPWGQTVIEQLYPAVQNNPKAWQFLMRQPPHVIVMRAAVLLAGVILVGGIMFRKRAGAFYTQPWDTALILTCVPALIYAGSFSLIPPTADARYLAPSFFIIWNACWIWVFFTIMNLRREKQSRLC